MLVNIPGLMMVKIKEHITSLGFFVLSVPASKRILFVEVFVCTSEEEVKRRLVMSMYIVSKP